MTRTFVVWNPRSGRALEAAEVRRRLERRPNIVVRESDSAENATELAREAVRGGFERIVAAGGDGTVNSVTNAMLGASVDVSLAVLPIGTANDFAYLLGVPDDLALAAALIESGQTRRLDLVEYETSQQRRCFANVATAGNSDRVTEMLTDELKQRWGPLCYLRGAVDVLADLESFDVAIQLDDEPLLQVRLWNLIIANGRTNAGHLPIAPRASAEDGLIDVILIRDGQLADLAEVSAKFVFGDYLESEQVLYQQVKSLTVSSKPEMRFSVDGEAIDEQPVAFRVLPQAIDVVVGPGYSAEAKLETAADA